MIVTNAAGGINLSYSRGALVAIARSHQSAGANPLIGPQRRSFWAALSGHDARLRQGISAVRREEGKRLKLDSDEGVYLALARPNYETPAEIQAFRRSARISWACPRCRRCLPPAQPDARAGNFVRDQHGRGNYGQPLTTEEVFETGARVKNDFIALLKAVIPQIEAWPSELTATSSRRTLARRISHADFDHLICGEAVARKCPCGLFEFSRGRRAARHVRAHFRRMQRGKRNLWLDDLRRARGHLQSDQRGRARLRRHRGCHGYRIAHATLRSLPPINLGILRRCTGRAFEPERQIGSPRDARIVPEAVRRFLSVITRTEPN